MSSTAAASVSLHKLALNGTISTNSHYSGPPTTTAEVPVQTQERVFRPVEGPAPSFTAQTPAQQNQFQEIPRFVPGEVNTLLPQQPHKEAPRLPDDSWRSQQTQAPIVETPQFVQPAVDLPHHNVPSFGRQPDRFVADRFQQRPLNPNDRKQEFIAPLAQSNAQKASIAPARFEAQPLPNAQKPFEISGNVPPQTRPPTFEVNGNVQRPTQQFFNVDQNVQRPTPQIFSVDNDAFRKRDPQPASTPKLETQFVAHPISEADVGRDTFDVDNGNASPGFGPNKEVKQFEPANPYATRQNPLPTNLNDKYIPPQPPLRPQGPIQTFDINSQYKPPQPPLRPEQPYNVPASRPPIQTFDINAQVNTDFYKT